jgi:hypothetical protein
MGNSRLPPGTTSADIDKHFGEPECEHCGRLVSNHRRDCFAASPACMVCNPDPDITDKLSSPYKKDVPVRDFPFCDEHSEEDYYELLGEAPDANYPNPGERDSE